MRYAIVFAESVDQLANLVNEYIKADWEPLGGFSIDYEGRVCQTLVNYFPIVELSQAHDNGDQEHTAEVIPLFEGSAEEK
jgi:hypothetical protein